MNGQQSVLAAQDAFRHWESRGYPASELDKIQKFAEFLGPEEAFCVAYSSLILELEQHRRPDFQSFLKKHPGLTSNPDLVCQLAIEYFELLKPEEPELSIEQFLAPFSTEFQTECLSLRSFIDHHQEGSSQVPERIGNIDILAVLGRGGSGIVYSGIDQQANHVAVKVIDRESLRHRHGKTQQKMVSRFEAEAKTGAFDHPRIVKLLESGIDSEAGFYIVMEFLEGPNLQDYVRQNAQRRRFENVDVKQHPASPTGGIPWRQAVEFILQAAEGMNHAHRKEIVHRDLKPGNLCLDSHGCVKILDFGLSRNLEDGEQGPRYTSTGEVFGTPEYMPPEALRSLDVAFPPTGALNERSLKSDRVDSKSRDIYGLGATLFFLLTGRPPFLGTVEELNNAILNVKAPNASRFNKDVPPNVAKICQHCMFKKIGNRYLSMTQLQGDLEQALQGRVVSKFPAFAWLDNTKQVGQKAVGLAAFALVAVIATYSLFAWSGEKSQSRLSGEFQTLLESIQPRRNDGQQVIANWGHLSEQLPGIADGLRELKGELDETQEQQFADKAAEMVFQRTIANGYQQHPRYVSDFDADVESIILFLEPLKPGLAHVTRDWLAGMRSGWRNPSAINTLEDLVPHFVANRPVEYESAENVITTTSRSECNLMAQIASVAQVQATLDIDQFKRDQVIDVVLGGSSNPLGETMCFSYHVNGKVSVALSQGSLLHIGADSGQYWTEQFASSSTGRLIAIASGRDNRSTLAFESGELRIRGGGLGEIKTASPAKNISAMEFSPDGNQFAVAGTSESGDVQLFIFDSATGNSSELPTLQSSSILDLAFSSSGKVLANCSRSGALEMLTLAEFQVPRTLSRALSKESQLAFHPLTHDLLAIGTKSILRWDRTFNELPAIQTDHQLTALAVSLRKSWLATGDHRGIVGLRSLENFAVEEEFVGNSQSIVKLAFAPSGARETLACASQAGDIELIDVARRAKVKRLGLLGRSGYLVRVRQVADARGGSVSLLQLFRNGILMSETMTPRFTGPCFRIVTEVTNNLIRVSLAETNNGLVENESNLLEFIDIERLPAVTNVGFTLPARTKLARFQVLSKSLDEGDSSLESADIKFRAGDFSTAIREYELSGQKYSDLDKNIELESLYKVGLCQFQLGKFAEAKNSFSNVASQAGDLFPEIAILALFRKWLILANEKRFEESRLVIAELAGYGNPGDEQFRKTIPLSLRNAISDIYHQDRHNLLDVMFSGDNLMARRELTVKAAEFLRDSTSMIVARRLDLVESMWIAGLESDALQESRDAFFEIRDSGGSLKGESSFDLQEFERALERYCWLLREQARQRSDSSLAQEGVDRLERHLNNASGHSGLLCLELARSYHALNRNTDAKKILDEFVRLPQDRNSNYGYYAQAYEMLGFIAEYLGQDPHEYWSQGTFDTWVSLLPEGQQASVRLENQQPIAVAHHFAMQGLGGNVDKEQLSRFAKRTIHENAQGIAYVKGITHALGDLLELELVSLSESVSDPKFKRLIETLAFKTTSFSGMFSLPIQYVVEHELVVGLGRELVKDERVVSAWLIRRGFVWFYGNRSRGNLFRVVALFSSFKNNEYESIGNELGQLPSELHAPLAYFFAVRFQENPEARGLFLECIDKMSPEHPQGSALKRLMKEALGQRE